MTARTVRSWTAAQRSPAAGGRASCPNISTRTSSPASDGFIRCSQASNKRAPPPSAPADRALTMLCLRSGGHIGRRHLQVAERRRHGLICHESSCDDGSQRPGAPTAHTRRFSHLPPHLSPHMLRPPHCTYNKLTIMHAIRRKLGHRPAADRQARRQHTTGGVGLQGFAEVGAACVAAQAHPRGPPVPLTHSGSSAVGGPGRRRRGADGTGRRMPPNGPGRVRAGPAAGPGRLGC